ncbi:MAG: DNA gyrase subunit A, partial [Lewinella sp.]|nr:DNA gyrase subunit A [Lewinella sp.]
ASKGSSGRVIQNILNIPKEDKVRAYIIMKDLEDKDFLDNHYIMFCTRQGVVKKTSVEAYSRPRAGGINAININDDDQLLEARLTTGDSEVFLATRAGNAIRFNEANVRAMGRTATGVRGISLLGSEDAVVGMICIDPADETVSVLVVSENGLGKRSDFQEYRLTNRGGKGVRTMSITAKTGHLVAIKAVRDGDDLMITNRSGIVIRTPVEDVRVMGRATQGVRIIRLDADDQIADVTVVPHEEGAEEEE